MTPFAVTVRQDEEVVEFVERATLDEGMRAAVAEERELREGKRYLPNPKCAAWGVYVTDANGVLMYYAGPSMRDQP